MPALTRGPLPARVYWVRRALVLLTAVLLVFALGRLLVGGGDGSSGNDRAGRVAARTAPTTTGSTATGSTTTPSITSPTAGATPTSTSTPTATPTARPTPTLAVPTGACRSSDVAVTPVVAKAVAGADVTIALELRTLISAACTWRITPETLTLDVTSGKDRVWSSRDCPKAIPHREVVVRRAVATTVDFVWKDARRSDDECTKRTAWARTGFYHVTAAAIGGEPADVQFELKTPTPITVTKTATPKQSPSKKASAKATKKPGKKPGKKPSGSPSGAVEPD